MVLEDVTELWVRQVMTLLPLTKDSDYSGTNTKLSKILLNGNNVCMVSGADLVEGSQRWSD